MREMEILMNYKIRELKQDEVNILNTFLYEVIFISDGVDAPPYEVINKPELQVYVAEFSALSEVHL